ncbi:hypothetical protein [Bacillus sp. T33-2]|uniref:hypothetical protein n=1 Tax=Bacillus sp. T33-2 TaxID=2054168 RepID=UPI000C77D62D|nr:hypothetical protein [Bacillus sp. T33-2]PLR92043.1 hypothetical protein CVD19_21085 [Bacillus sp. T33-2]
MGTATAVHEKIFSIDIEQNRVVIQLKKNNKQTYVYFEESFFVNAARNVIGMFKIVEKARKNGEELSLASVGNVEKREGEICLVINPQRQIRINEMPIETFVFNYNNPGF